MKFVKFDCISVILWKQIICDAGSEKASAVGGMSPVTHCTRVSCSEYYSV